MSGKLHIRIFIICFLVCLLLSNCQSPKNKTLEQLQGVWYIDCDSIRSEDDLRGFEFVKDTVGTITHDGTFIDHILIVKNDSLYFNEFFSAKKELRKIRKLTRDTLWLENDGNIEKYHAEKLDNNSKLKYSRIEIDLGYFENPGIRLSLDSIGNIVSNQRVINKWIIKRYRLSNKELNQVDSVFKYSRVDKFKIFNWTDGYDGWPKMMRIKVNGKWVEFKTINTGFHRRLSSTYYFITQSAIKRKIWIER